MKKTAALVDLIIVFIIITVVWSLRFLGLSFVGPITMAVGIVLVFSLLRLRDQHRSVIGLGPIPPGKQLLTEALKLFLWFGAAWFIGGFIGTALFGQPEKSSAVSQLPNNIWGFLIDVTLITWILIGFGEETVFRGFVLNRLLVFTGESQRGIVLASLIQAVWFGTLHASQGGAGMILTGLVGFVFGWFYLSRSSRSLWPLIIVHATTDTIILSISWLLR